jgi:hypothetical protein
MRQPGPHGVPEQIPRDDILGEETMTAFHAMSPTSIAAATHTSQRFSLAAPARLLDTAMLPG